MQGYPNNDEQEPGEENQVTGSPTYDIANYQNEGADHNQRHSTIWLQTSHLFLLGGNELITLAVDINNLNLRVFLQMLAQLGDIDIHRTGIEIVVIDPNSL